MHFLYIIHKNEESSIIQSLEGIEILGVEHRLYWLFDNYPKFTDHWSMITASYRNIGVFEALATVIRGVIICE